MTTTHTDRRDVATLLQAAPSDLIERAPHHVQARVADDLGLRRCPSAVAIGEGLAEDVVPFRAAMWLLDILTTADAPSAS